MSEYQVYDYERGWFRSDNRREPYFSTPDDEAFARAEAFGAIRRAAEVARELQEQGNKSGDSMLEYDYAEYAYNVRRAIRAAIGSDKT